MFKKLTIATAITSALFSSHLTAEALPLVQMNLQNTAVTGTDKSRFIVKFKQLKQLPSQHAAIVRDTPIHEKGESQLAFQRTLASGDIVVEVANFSTMDNLLNDLSLNGDVISIEEDEVVYSHHVPNDYYANSMYSIENSNRGINAVAAWDLSYGEDVNVAIIDTGYTEHPDYAERSINGYDMISYLSHSIDGNARDNDAHDPGTGIGCDNKSSSWHGTHVAGIIGASIDNTIGAVGIAPKANLTHVRALGKCSSGYRSDIIDSIYWAAGKSLENIPVNPNPAKVINLSLGSQSSCGSYQSAIDYARSQGSTVVVSAGNNNESANNQAPANCNGVIVVAASDNTGDKASYSNFSMLGGAVDITAPGSSIIAPVNSSSLGPVSPGYGYKSGTSMAAPQVAGIVALMLEKNPSLTPNEIEQVLKDTADQFLAGTTCYEQGLICGYGLVNAESAIKKAISLAAPSVITLDNNVPLKISGEEGTESEFNVIVPEGADQITVSIDSGIGDADLYVKHESQASLTHYDCRPFKTGNNEICHLTEHGQYSIMVRGYQNYSDVNLTASFHHPENNLGTEITNNQVQWNLSGDYLEELVFWADIPEGVTTFWVQTWNGSGDADLWVKQGAAPSAQDNDCYQSTPGNEETCTVSSTPGRYFIKVRGYDAFNNVALRIIW